MPALSLCPDPQPGARAIDFTVAKLAILTNVPGCPLSVGTEKHHYCPCQMTLGSGCVASAIALTRFGRLPWNLGLNIIDKESYALIVGGVQPEHPVKNTHGFAEAT